MMMIYNVQIEYIRYIDKPAPSLSPSPPLTLPHFVLCHQVNSWLDPAANPWELAAGAGAGATGAMGAEEDLSSHVTAATDRRLSQLSSSLRNREFHGFETPKIKARGGEGGIDGRDPLGIRDAAIYDGFDGVKTSPAANSHQHASGAVTHRAVLQAAEAAGAAAAGVGHVPADKPWLKRLNALQCSSAAL